MATFGQCSYAAAKEGIRGLSRVAATEWGKDGINVNVICPLAWTAKLEQFQQAYPDAFKANVKMPPMGHYANPETEIGRVCVQLAMPDSSICPARPSRWRAAWVCARNCCSHSSSYMQKGLCHWHSPFCV